jgi:hypothetical protein
MRDFYFIFGFLIPVGPTGATCNVSYCEMGLSYRSPWSATGSRTDSLLMQAFEAHPLYWLTNSNYKTFSGIKNTCCDFRFSILLSMVDGLRAVTRTVLYTSTNVSFPSVSFTIRFTFKVGILSYAIPFATIEHRSYVAASQVGTLVFCLVCDGLHAVVCVIRSPTFRFLPFIFKIGTFSFIIPCWLCKSYGFRWSCCIAYFSTNVSFPSGNFLQCCRTNINMSVVNDVNI